MKIFLYVISSLIGFIIISIASLFIYAVNADFHFEGGSGFSWTETGQIGDFFGGIIGTLLSAIGFIFVFLSFQKQAEALNSQKEEIKKHDQQFEKSQIENRFIELIKLHKDNLNDIVYEGENKVLEGRKAIDFIYNQVLECISEITPFFETASVGTIFKPDYLIDVSKISSTRPSLNLATLAKIDIAYSIVFFGTSADDLQTLVKLFEKRYERTFFMRILQFTQLKARNSELRQHWAKIKDNPFKVFEENETLRTGSSRKVSADDWSFAPSPVGRLLKQNYIKYYGGHQYKLGHYYRHLYQTVKYINKRKDLKYQEQYDYIKTLRAQLSTIEQYLLFFNSLSFMGRAWELDDLCRRNINKDNWLITKYNLIKNLPNIGLFNNNSISDFYPGVNFEFEEWPKSRPDYFDHSNNIGNNN